MNQGSLANRLLKEHAHEPRTLRKTPLGCCKLASPIYLTRHARAIFIPLERIDEKHLPFDYPRVCFLL
jgi:hypothetical protein